ncbi:MAG: hypothetical protein A3F84_18200 [Candidatus Handelsmanbacteria bacterium RIFCSPLOWO2_12_FULL_64_10]|uniref:Lambda-carrageenase beta-propeller domain-containing protein n=1 Tax=Handelsmanbacteria sp. (strain RIFCSPLOWO2_12_FULL_64_10) TaxID=1817868 RepID=A0A1F6CCW6_HANXR|nr:MAG: hypothetical protein A3F84_18200 [Candidatus Handelsmanbacteria bacterium RIFCSPLOWO2_12_FULL_64_10]
MSEQTITRLKDMRLITALVREGQAEAQIVTPEDDAYLEAARSIQARVREVSGVELAIKRDAEAGEGPQAWHTVAVGNLSNNAVIRALYRRWYTLVDRTHPGRGGYVLQTVHDPWGLGKNVVVVGASDGAGTGRGAERLGGLLQAGDAVTVGQVFLVEMGADRGREREALAQWAGDPPEEAWGYGLEGEGIAHAGLYYVATGDDRFAARFREGMLAMERDAPEGIPERQVHLTFYQKTILWDVLEESPVFSDEDRLRITNTILRVLRSEEGHANRGFQHHLKVRAPKQNHQTLLGMALFFGGTYFEKYYRLPEAKQWLRDVATLFKDYDAHSKPVCDCNFHGWACTLENIATYALAGGGSRFFESGMAREAADRGIISCDNLGYMPVLGDCQTAWGYPTSLFQKAAHYYRDGRYAFMVKRRMEALGDFGFRLGRHMSDELGRLFDDVDPVVPTDMIGIRVARLDDLYYRMPETDPDGARGMFVLPPNVPHEKTFDKMSFRTGFEPDDQYMLFDGVGGGSHSFEDVNSIVEFSQHGKTFLVTEDSLHWPNFRDHNVVTVVRDGYGATPPTFAGMDLVADLDRVGFTRTYLKDYNGVDWTRNIVWEKGGCFLALDEVEAREGGEYTLECRWKLVGDPALTEGRLTVTQWGHACSVLNADGARLWTEAVNIGSWSDWQPEEHARRQRRYGREDLVAHVLHQGVVQEIKEGGRYTFLNALVATPGQPRVDFRQVGSGVVQVVAPEGAALAGVYQGSPFKQGPLKVEAQLFRVTGRGLALARGTEVSAGRALFSSDRPVSVEYDLVAGRGVLIADRRTEVKLLVGDEGEVKVDGEPVPKGRPYRRDGKTTVTFRVPAGRHEVEGTPVSEGDALLARLREAVEAAPHPPHHRVHAHEAPALAGREVWRFRSGDEFPSFGVGDVDGDGPSEIVVGSMDGRVFLMNADGRLRWSRRVGGPINSIAIADVDGDGRGEIVAGSDDCGVYLLSADGPVRWRYEPPFGLQYWPWWTLGASKVKKILVDDVDGDGAQEVIAGVANMRLHALDARGKEKWSFRTDHGVFVTMTTADVDGDGLREIVGGMAIKSSNSACFAVGGDGRLKRRYANQGWTSQLTAVAVEDLDEDGRPEVICGTNRGENLRVFDAGEGTCRWGHNLGDVVTGVAVGAFDGRRVVVAGSRSFSVSAFYADGEEAWTCNVGAPVGVLKVCDVNGDGEAEVLAGCEDGGVWVIDGRGEKVGRIPGEGRVTGIWRGRLRAKEGPVTLVGTSDGVLRAFEV